MNQRLTHRRRNSAMPFGQLIQRRNSRRVAQHHGHVTSSGTVLGDAFRAGLGFGHSSNFRCDVAHEFDGIGEGNPARHRLNGRCAVLGIGGALNPQQAVLRAGADGRVNGASGEGGITQVIHGVHCSSLWSKQFAAVAGMDRLSVIFIQPERHATGIDVNPFTRSGGKHDLCQFQRDIRRVRVCRSIVHGYLRSEEIPPMDEPYSLVTCNASTFDIAPQQATA